MSGAGVQGSLEEIEQRRQHNLVDVILTDERTNVYRLIPDSRLKSVPISTLVRVVTLLRRVKPKRQNQMWIIVTAEIVNTV